METFTVKPNLLGNILVRLVSFVVLVFLARFAYVFTVRGGNSCNSGHFFLPENPNSISGNGDFQDSGADHRSYYYSVFQDLIADGYLSPHSKSLCINTLTGHDVAALIDVGVVDSIGIFEKSSQPLIQFDDNSFDFEFAGNGVVERSLKPVEFAIEVSRTLKVGGFFVVHTMTKDNYSLHSLIQLFESCRFIKSRDIDSFDTWHSSVREVIFKKVMGFEPMMRDTKNKCGSSEYKWEVIGKVESLIEEEPLKPWITLKKNMRNVKYLSSMVDISFKNRYIYVDVGARSYTSSIGGWFNKQYPKQNKSFEVFAIEADREFHDEYRRKGVNLLPYAAWVRNETLFFEISREPSRKHVEKGRGMGRVQSAQSSLNFMGDLYKIKGFDFARWLMSLAEEKDYLVVKMDVEGTEFHLIPRLIETGAICLIDEMFLECHYNRWQRCCPGERSPKYEKNYTQCLELFSSLRESGVLVHQWW